MVARIRRHTKRSLVFDTLHSIRGRGHHEWPRMYAAALRQDWARAIVSVPETTGASLATASMHDAFDAAHTRGPADSTGAPPAILHPDIEEPPNLFAEAGMTGSEDIWGIIEGLKRFMDMNERRTTGITSSHIFAALKLFTAMIESEAEDQLRWTRIRVVGEVGEEAIHLRCDCLSSYSIYTSDHIFHEPSGKGVLEVMAIDGCIQLLFTCPCGQSFTLLYYQQRWYCRLYSKSLHVSCMRCD